MPRGIADYNMAPARRLTSPDHNSSDDDSFVTACSDQGFPSRNVSYSDNQSDSESDSTMILDHRNTAELGLDNLPVPDLGNPLENQENHLVPDLGNPLEHQESRPVSALNNPPGG